MERITHMTTKTRQQTATPSAAPRPTGTRFAGLTPFMALLTAGVVSISATSGAHAANGEWVTNGDGNWDDSTNWVAGTIADGAGFTADFLFNPTPGSGATITLDSSRTIGHLEIGDTTSSFRNITITPATAETLTFDNGGTGSTLYHGGGGGGSSSAVYRIDTDIVLADNLTITRDVSNIKRFFRLFGNISETGGPRSITHTGVDDSTATEITGVNTYTGDTDVQSGALALSDTSELRFVIQDGNVSNSVLGDGTVDFDGLFRLDSSGLTASAGSWNLVDVVSLTETFGDDFGLAFVGDSGATFTADNGYTNGDWNFNLGTGNLTLIPEPASLALMGLGGLLICSRRGRA